MAFFSLNEDGPGISGDLVKGEIYKPSLAESLVCLSTKNIENSLKKVLETDGEILFPKADVPNYVWIAEFRDSEG